MADECSAEPILIQGGMGVAVSSWQLAKAVARRGQLGVVSGTAIDAVLVRRLQQGDAGGHIRRAMAEFPFPEMTQRILARYFIEGGKAEDEPFATTIVLPQRPNREQFELVVVANFVEVFLAKEGHSGKVGINFLEKIQSPTLPSIYGAMLADVDYVLMGAGIPRSIPGILDKLSRGEPVSLPLNIAGAKPEDDFRVEFSPVEFTAGEVPWLNRPKFLAIVASATLAIMLARKADGHVDGFVLEGPSAGGHNAPPRGKATLNERGEPVYGKRDEVDLESFRKLGRPFWLAGSYGSPEQVANARSQGAVGVQVGTAFAFCDESGMDRELKRRVIESARQDSLQVMTDPDASPTGFPFKVLELEGTISDASSAEQRKRVCDLGFLRQGYRRDDGAIGWRCPGEHVKSYIFKGGDEADTVGRKCICNGLMATIGLGQHRRDGDELPLLTCGNEVQSIIQFLPTAEATSYGADDVIDCLVAKSKNEVLQGVCG
ncbi:MAG: nitronate monooxygenase [Rubripirellula sp.]|nr:nitronate monooxygenase [Rubripirellula sp.]